MTRTRSNAAGLLALAAVLGLVPGAASARIRHAPQTEALKPLPEPEPAFPFEAVWTLVALNDKAAGSDPPSFRLDRQFRASGFSGCNTYSMTLYVGRGQRLLAGSIAVTRKACAADVMLRERQFLVALHSVPTWAVINDELVVKAPGAALRFRRGI